MRWRPAIRPPRDRATAVAGAALLVLTAAGYAAPLLAAHVTHFAYDEAHPRLAFAPPGTLAVPRRFPTYDKDPAVRRKAFALADLDGDGRVACRRERLPTADTSWLRVLARWSPTLHRRALARLAELDRRVPVRAILRAVLGPLRCPELDELARLARYFDLLIDTYDGRASGPGAPPNTPRNMPPSARDGRLTWDEFPHADADLADAAPGRPSRYAHRGLTGRAAFDRLDGDGDGALTQAEITRATRTLRFAPRDLLARFDRDGDLALGPAELPGPPEPRPMLLGADGRGRDVLTRLLYGARMSLTIGLLTTLVGLALGVLYGAAAGAAGGWLDEVMMRLVDVLYGLPYLVLVIVLIALLGPSTVNLFLALALVSWLNLARIVRGQVLSLRAQPFVQAARALGASHLRVLLRHILPNALGPVLAYATLMVPAVILQEAFLSFLGLGVQAPEASWGTMIQAGADHLSQAPWLMASAGAALAVTLYAMNQLGDGLRDALDPAHAAATAGRRGPGGAP